MSSAKKRIKYNDLLDISETDIIHQTNIDKNNNKKSLRAQKSAGVGGLALAEHPAASAKRHQQQRAVSSRPQLMGLSWAGVGR